MVIININNVWSRISGLKNIELVDNLDKVTSYFVENYQYSKAYRTGYYNKKTGSLVYWDGCKHLLNQKMCFPTGLLERITDFFDLNNVKYEIVDNRKKVEKQKEIPLVNFTPRYYQNEALEAAIKNERGLIKISVGGGKTALAAMIVAKYNVPSMIYVIGKDLLYQFHEEVNRILGIPIGLIGDGNCNIEKINVCSIWTAITSFNLKINISLDDEDWDPEVKQVNSREKEYIRKQIENCKLSIYDEAHFLATDTLQSIYKASKESRYHFAMTASNWRDDGADLLLESVAGKKIYDLPSSRLIEEGYLVQPKIVFFEVPKYNGKLSSNYIQIYSQYITKNDIRNGMIEDCVRNLINKNRKVLILVKYISHGKEIAKRLSDIPLFFVNGKVDGETRNKVKKDFQEGKLKCLIASSVFDIGVNIPIMDALVLGGSGKSTIKSIQRIGRVIRIHKDKKDAIIVDFIDNAKYLLDHSYTRITVYETEPKFIIKFPKGFDDAKIKRSKKVKEKVKS